MDLNKATSTLRATLASEASAYGVTLDEKNLEVLGMYYEILQRWNSRVHLVAPCTPEEFATRHILESLVMLRYLPVGAKVAEVGSGGGLPMLPCLIVREDLTAVLFEISQKKSVFLREALIHTGVSTRALVRNERFEDTDVPPVSFLTCRALERFEEMLPYLIKWAPPDATLLLFGARRLEKRIEGLGLKPIAELIPRSKARFLYIVTKN
jgi:16S rRNA (guanine527-N7)-methyltransferase